MCESWSPEVQGFLRTGCRRRKNRCLTWPHTRPMDGRMWCDDEKWVCDSCVCWIMHDTVFSSRKSPSQHTPYRKPTQVNVWNTLRRMRYPLWRNSANSPSNLGRTGTLKKVAVNWGWRLFTKNTGLCKCANRRIGSETCPVLEAHKDMSPHEMKGPVNGGCNTNSPKVAKFLVG